MTGICIAENRQNIHPSAALQLALPHGKTKRICRAMKQNVVICLLIHLRLFYHKIVNHDRDLSLYHT